MYVRGMRVKRDIDEDGVWGCNGGWGGYQLGVYNLGVLDVWMEGEVSSFFCSEICRPGRVRKIYYVCDGKMDSV